MDYADYRVASFAEVESLINNFIDVGNQVAGESTTADAYAAFRSMFGSSSIYSYGMHTGREGSGIEVSGFYKPSNTTPNRFYGAQWSGYNETFKTEFHSTFLVKDSNDSSLTSDVFAPETLGGALALTGLLTMRRRKK